MIFCGAFIGTFFILQHQCSVAEQAEVIRGHLVNSDLLILPPEDKPEACQKDVRGEGIFIDRIVFVFKGKECHRDISPKNSSYDKSIWQAVARECNGKNRCKLSDSKNHTVGVKCEDQLTLANQIDINYECKPIKPDNQKVFNITPELSANVTAREFNTSYLVLDLTQARPTEIHCEIKGNNRELKFTLLHVDFGPNLNCNRSYTCHGRINITDDKMKTINYTYNWLPSDTFNPYLKFVTFDVSMSTGLLWIQLEGYTEIDVKCVEINNTGTTDQIPDTTEVQPSEVTITTTDGNRPTKNTTTLEVDDTTVEEDGTTVEEEGSVGAQGVPLKVVIPAGVAGLLALLVIALCVACACSANSPLRRWKRSKRRELQEEIRYPLRDEYDYVTTNEILDCRPGSPLTAQTKQYPGKDPHHGDNDYMEVNSYEETSLVTTPTSTTALHPRSGSHPGPRLTPVPPDTPTPTGPTTAKWALARSSGLKSPGGPGEAVESTYALVDNEGEPSSEPSVLYSATKAPSAGEITTAKSLGEDTEYSHLNDVTTQRNAENVYDG